MGIVTRAGDWSFKAFTAGLGLATIYLTATFSFNVYRGLSWHLKTLFSPPLSLLPQTQNLLFNGYIASPISFFLVFICQTLIALLLL
jgi:hypothetical protein